ncbi:MAG: restriction endonuclease [Idiomarinaceae bacterium]|nr:restriction endonuclease [Idiomarinaceae bacterium]|tara:strand:- start:518 stop:2140 length:1623 start_codon:yes stop_codon:yes gene_type:complete
MLSKVLAGMSYEGLSHLINPSIFGIINEFEAAPSPSRLAELVLDIYGGASLLRNKKSRDIILEYLDQSSAVKLLQGLGVSYNHEKPWDALSRIRFTQDRIDILFNFFCVDESLAQISNDNEEHSFCEAVLPEYGLFPHQERAAIEIKRELKRARSRVLLHMPTGSGKTRTAMSILSDYMRNSVLERQKCLVVWLADTEELCDQAATAFKEAWNKLGVGSSKLYRCHGKIDVDLSEIEDGFVVMGLQKLNALSRSQQQSYYQLCSKTRLVVFDEAHKAIASTYKHAIELFDTIGSASVLGLSATPGRAVFDDDENRRFAEFFNYRKVSLDIPGYTSPIEYLQKEGYLADVEYHDIDYHSSDFQLLQSDIENIADGKEPTDDLLNRLGQDQKRNIQILSEVSKLVSKGKKIILFMPSVESANGMFALLRYKGIKAGLITNETAGEVRASYISKYKKGDLDLLVNHGVLTTGFDAPITNVAVIARPTNSLTLFSQMIGRAIRGPRVMGNALADIYVVKDTLPGLRDMRKAFEYWDDSWGVQNG